MGVYDLQKYKGHDQLQQRFQELKKNPVLSQSGFDALAEAEKTTFAMQHMFMTEQEKQEEQAQLRQQLGDFVLQLQEQREQWEQDQFRYQQMELAKNKNDKSLAKLKTPEEIAALREERQQKAIKADERKVFADKARHGFYKFVGGFVKFGRWISGADKAEKETAENPEYEVPGLFQEYWRLENMRPDETDPDFGEKIKPFNEKYKTYYDSLKEQYQKKDKAAQEEAEQKVHEAELTLGKELTEQERADAVQRNKRSIMEAATYKLKFGDSVQSHVEGGTKPNAFQYAQDGSQWLMKTNHSCIGAAAPNASIMTVAGYKVQKLVNPDTAIEAFESKSKGVGTVSLQRMVEGVVSRTKKVNGQKVPDPDYVDLFRFSRTPEAMTPDELEKVEKLAPHFLREYMTDYLLGNYDTKGENFLICRDKEGKLTVRGIDKEAAGRKDLVPEAQHMQKDIHFFDQDTVYNQLFRKFADGTMNFDLQNAAQYIERIEKMSKEEYMKIYAPYLEQQKKDRTPEELAQIEKNVTYRKEFIRVEARRFFGELVKERMQACPEEAEELQKKYLGGVENGIFLFNGETAEQLKAEREKIASRKEQDAASLEKQVKKADEADEKSYKRRHAMYDFAKSIIMGVKSKPGDDYVEKRTTKVRISELDGAAADTWGDSLAEIKPVFDRHLKELFDAHGAKVLSKHKIVLHQEFGEQLKEEYIEKNWKAYYDDALAQCRKAVLDEYLKNKPVIDSTEDEKYLEQIQRTKEAEIKEKAEQLYEENKEVYLEVFVKSVEEAVDTVILQEAEKLTREEIEQSDNEALWKKLEKEALRRTEAEKDGTVVELRMEKEEQIFLGGTKPMSQYIAADGTKWLAKQAVTCVGTSKPSGAILTEIGSNIQKLVDKETAVDAFVGQTRTQGMVSFQRRLSHVVSSKKLDLFKFSRHPELATQKTIRQVESLMPQILREHVTDWLLCNFDTKGENFILTQEEGQPMVLHGIDKEAAFNKILDPAAQQMSTTYKPHANNTLYNVVFEKFANAEMDFDLKAASEQIRKIADMNPQEYLKQYTAYFDYLADKAQKDGSEKALKKATDTIRNIGLRQRNLLNEYKRFFKELVDRRCEKVHPKEAEELRTYYFGSPNGTEFQF